MNKKYKTLLGLALLLAGLGTEAHGQAQSVNMLGHNLAEEGLTMAVLPNGGTVYGGRRFTPNTGSKVGYIVWENPTNFGVPDLARTYTLNSADLAIQSIDAAQPSGTLAAVANKTGAGAGDAVFMHLSATGTVLFAKGFTTTNLERLEQVKCLSDGSFLLVGSIQNPNSQMKSAFVTKLGSATQGYAVQWSRVLGTIGGNVWTFDYAAAADQYTDGSVLVCGFTDQAATTTAGAVFLWKLSATGTTLALMRYEMGSSVNRPFPTDMRLLQGGTVQLIGNVVDGNGAFKGFQMQVSPDFLTSVYMQLESADDPTRAIELRGLDLNSGGSAIWAAGTMFSTNSSGAVDQEGLLVQFSNLTGMTRSHTVGFTGQDILNDVKIDGLLGLRTGGLSNKAHNAAFNLNNTNVMNTRTNTLGLNCLLKDVSLVARKVSSTASGFSIFVGTSMTLSSITVVTSTVSVGGLSSCATARMGEFAEEDGGNDEVYVGDEAALLYPNPTQGATMLRLPEGSGPADVVLYDLRGQMLRQWSGVEQELSLEMAGLSRGMYLVQVRQSRGVQQLKLVRE